MNPIALLVAHFLGITTIQEQSSLYLRVIKQSSDNKMARARWRCRVNHIALAEASFVRPTYNTMCKQAHGRPACLQLRHGSGHCCSHVRAGFGLFTCGLLTANLRNVRIGHIDKERLDWSPTIPIASCAANDGMPPHGVASQKTKHD